MTTIMKVVDRAISSRENDKRLDTDGGCFFQNPLHHYLHYRSVIIPFLQDRPYFISKFYIFQVQILLLYGAIRRFATTLLVIEHPTSRYLIITAQSWMNTKKK